MNMHTVSQQILHAFMVAKRYVLLDVANKHNLIGFEKACTLRTAE